MTRKEIMGTTAGAIAALALMALGIADPMIPGLLICLILAGMLGFVLTTDKG